MTPDAIIPRRPCRTGRRPPKVPPVVTAAACLAIAACNPAATDEHEAGARTVLEIGMYEPSGGGAQQTLHSLVQRFESEHRDIDVRLEVAPYDQFFTRLRTELAGGQAPDVWLSDGVLVQEFAERGALLPLTDRIADLDTDQYLGVELNEAPDGETYAFPQGIQVPALFYNKQMFDQAGLDYPTDEWSYEDLTAAAEKLTLDTNGDGKTDQYGFRIYSPSFTETWWPMVHAFGGEVLGEDNRQAIIDTPESEAALQWMLSGIYQREFAADPAESEALGDPIQQFAEEKVAMSFGIYARILAAQQAGIDYGLARLPIGPGAERGEPAIVNSWVVNAAASQAEADAAWQWITYFAGAEPQRQWAELGEALPVNREVVDSEEFLTSAGVDRTPFVEALADAEAMDLNAVWAEYATAINDALTEALARSRPPSEALTRAQAEAQAVLDRQYN